MAKRPNEKNERIKRRYAQFLKEAKRLAETSIDKAMAAIDRFEDATGKRDFASFRIEQAIAFKSRLSDEISQATGRPLAKGTVHGILKCLRAFFLWLAEQSGYRSKISYSDADYFNASHRDVRIARDAIERPSPSPEQVLYVLSRMPAGSILQKRDRALIAFLLLTGIRDGAAIGLKLRHVDLADRLVHQDAREIATKFSKSMRTWFFPVGRDVEQIFADYVDFLRNEMRWGPGDPLFPASKVAVDANGSFAAVSIQRTHWQSAARIRAIVGDAFESQGMPRFGPHSFRKTLARLSQQLCSTPEQVKIWSQNLGHDDVLTTFRSYGAVPAGRQRELLAEMRDAVACAH